MDGRGRRRARMSAALGGILLLSACAGSSGIAPAATATTTTTRVATSAAPVSTTTTLPPAGGGTVIVGLADAPGLRTLNPLIAGPDTAVLDLLMPAVAAQGFDWDPVTRLPIPDVFVSVPSFEDGSLADNGDGTIAVTFTIDPAAAWDDGAAISTEDLEFTYAVATDPDHPIRPEVRNAYETVVPGSLRADGNVLTLTMKAGGDPARLFDVILPKHQVEGSDLIADWSDTAWVGAGPYRVERVEPGQFVELARADGYWRDKDPAATAARPERIVFRFFPPGTDIDPRLVTAVETGEMAVALFAEAESRSNAFASAMGAGLEVTEVPTGEWYHLNFQFGPANRNEISLNSLVEFRKAVAYSLDRVGLADGRGVAIVDSLLARFVPEIHQSPYEVYRPDHDQVTSLLYDIEVATGRDTFAGDGPDALLTVAGDDAATVALAGDVVTMLRAGGIDAQLQIEEADSFYGATLDNGSWDLSLWKVSGGTGLADAIRFFRLFDPDGLPFIGHNFFRWGTIDSSVDDAATSRYRELIDELSSEVAPVRVREILEEAERILADQAVIIPLIVGEPGGVAYWPNRISGLVVNPVEGLMWNVADWSVTTG